MNKTAQFLLPLCGGLNSRSFSTEENFVDAYLSPSYKEVIIELHKIPIEVTFLPGYRRHWKIGEMGYVELYVEDKFIPDIQKFIKGQYRAMSEEAITRAQQAVLFIYRDEKKSNMIEDSSYENDVRFSRHAICIISHNGKESTVSTHPLLAAIAPSTNGGYQQLKKQIEKKIGSNLPDGAELLSPPNMEKEVCPRHKFKPVNQVRVVSGKSEQFKLNI